MTSIFNGIFQYFPPRSPGCLPNRDQQRPQGLRQKHLGAWWLGVSMGDTPQRELEGSTFNGTSQSKMVDDNVWGTPMTSETPKSEFESPIVRIWWSKPWFTWDVSIIFRWTNPYWVFFATGTWKINMEKGVSFWARWKCRICVRVYLFRSRLPPTPMD